MSNPFTDPVETANPYAPSKPAEFAHQHTNPLFVPGLLILLGSLFWAFYMVAAIAIMLSPNGPLRGEELAYIRVSTGISYAAMFVLTLIAAAGAIAMMRLKWKALAWTGCIIGMLPMFGPCFGMTLPLAIWALILLRRSEVNASFS